MSPHNVRCLNLTQKGSFLDITSVSFFFAKSLDGVFITAREMGWEMMVEAKALECNREKGLVIVMGE